MPSPFPGMDPYIESPVHWPDFHLRLINSLCEMIAQGLPEPYFARIAEDVVLLEPEPPRYKAQPDIWVAKDSGNRRDYSGGNAGLATLEPRTLENLIALDPHIEYSIEILRLPEAEAVTVIEVLSPTNKLGGGRGFYSDKRGRILRGPTVNLVEFDLLRAGKRIQLVQPLPPGDYHALLSRTDRWPRCEVYSWTMRDPLPRIPIPLRAPDPDVVADLAEAFAMAYERGRYGRLIRYDQPPPPPALSPEDAQWLGSITRAA